MTAGVGSVGLKVGHEKVTSTPTDMAAQLFPVSSNTNTNTNPNTNTNKKYKYNTKTLHTVGQEEVTSRTNMAAQFFPMPFSSGFATHHCHNHNHNIVK